MDEQFPDDPTAPVFFLSYARARPVNRTISAPYEVNSLVLRLFTDLTAVVNELIALTPGQDLGFMDQTMDSGERWQARLLRAAGSCQVFIPLLSTPYLQRSEWCAMEWDVFSRRKVVPRQSQPDQADRTDSAIATGIVPVLWAPIRRRIPPVIAEINRFTPTDLPDPSYEAQYRDHGILGLLRMKLWNAYEAVVWKLALQIQQMHHVQWVEPAVPASITGLRRSFSEEAQ